MNLVINEKWLGIVYFSLLIIFLGCVYPAMYCLVWFGQANPQLAVLVFCLWLALHSYVNKSLKLKLPDRFFLCIFFVAFAYHLIRLTVFNERGIYPVVADQVLILLALIMCVNSLPQKKLMNYLVNWHILMMCCMLVGVVLLILGILPLINYYILVEDSGLTLFNFGLFFVKARMEYITSLSAMRPTGWFDEPGSFANVILFILIYNRMYIKSKKIEMLFLLGGLVTLSMAHVIISIVWYCFFYLKRNLVSILTVSFVGLLLVAGYFWQPDNEFAQLFQNATFKRVENVANNEDASRNYDGAYNAFKTHFLTGATLQTLEKEFPNATSETLWYNLAQNGLVGSFIFFLPIWYVGYDMIRKRKLTSMQAKFLFLVFLNFGQRPDYYYSLYFIFIYYLWYNHVENKTSQSRVISE